MIRVYCVLLQDWLWPVVRRLHAGEDRALHSRLTRLYRLGLTADQLGLSPALALPLPAALVELAALDSRTTPLDKLSTLADTLDQLRAQSRAALLEEGHRIKWAGCLQPQCARWGAHLPPSQHLPLERPPLGLRLGLQVIETSDIWPGFLG